MAEQPNEAAQRENVTGLPNTELNTSPTTQGRKRTTLLPFSPLASSSGATSDAPAESGAALSGNYSASDEENETPETVRRRSDLVSQLQLKQLELRLDLKTVRDQLAALGKQHASEDAQGNSVHDSSTGQSHYGNAPWESIEQLQKTNLELNAEKESLLAKVCALEREGHSHSEQINELIDRVKTFRDRSEPAASNLGNGTADLETEQILELRRQLKNSRDESSELRNSERRLLNENLLFKKQLEELRSNKRASSDSSMPYEGYRSKITSVERSRAQIKALLEEQLAVNDRNDVLLDEANKHIQMLTTQNETLLQSSEKSIFGLRQSLREADAAKIELATQVENFKLQLKDFETLKAQLVSEKESHLASKSTCRELESRIVQQQGEISQLTDRLSELGKRNSESNENERQTQSKYLQYKALLSEAKRDNERLSELLNRKEQDYIEAQRVIDRVREELHQKDNDLAYSQREKAQQESNQKQLHDQLLAKNEEIVKVSEAKNEEVHKLHKELADLKAQAKEMEQKHAQIVKDLTDQKEFALTRSHKIARDEIERLTTAHNERLGALNETNVRLETRLLDLQSETDGLKAERDKNLARLRLLESQKLRMDNHDEEISGRLTEAHELLRGAKLDAAEIRSKYEKAHRAEEALTEKLKEMEQTISGQAVRLQSLQSHNIEALMKQAEEAKALSAELAMVKEELSRQALQRSAIESQAQHVSQLNLELEEKLQTLQNSEKHRQSQFESYLTTIYNREYEKALGDFGFKEEQLKQSLKKATLSSEEAQASLVEREKGLQEALQDARDKAQHINDLESWIDGAKQEISRLQTSFSSSQTKEVHLFSNVEGLQARLEEANSTVARLQDQLAQLESQHTETHHKFEKEARTYKATIKNLETKEALARDWVHHLLNIYKGLTQQLNSLVFAKRYYSSVFPPEFFIFDLDKTPIVTTRTFRGAALAVLAAIKFRKALLVGAKKTVKASEDSISQTSDRPARQD